MKKAVQSMTSEITDRLLMELVPVRKPQDSQTIRMIDEFLDRLVDKVVAQNTVVRASGQPKQGGLRARLAKVEEKLSRLVVPCKPEEEVKPKTEADLSNLKYAAPKYKNLDAVMKYGDEDEGKSAVKLVIMNFND